MLKIKLKRSGKKNQPIYNIVVSENLSSRNGKSIAILGFYNPITKLITCNKNILLHYLNNGAYPTNTVRNLISKIIFYKSN